ncbi:hypothetical protein PC116_g18290 [Phytophthora cactorum]|nr:hypothetical protein C6341_g5460 [Phytophthora cactorum]KAG4058623.1 hypothetical protein PC123_g6443 [Phytophthora cactorum]KAG4233512.1 hypothetical protein PC116_g18290 [Phytophthora cactorum]
MMAITRSSLALVLMVSAISSDISTAFSNLRTTPRNLQTYSSYDGYFQQMLDAVNAERTKAGLSALCTNKKLAAAAARHSKDMADNDFMEHDGSDGSTMSERITDAGYAWNAVAENVAAGQEDVASVMESWMNSEGHRANILSADYTMFGTAYAYNADSTYKHYWTQDFGAGDTEACDSGTMAAPIRSSITFLLVVAGVLVSTSAASNLRHTSRSLQTYTQTDDYQIKMLELVNEQRTANSLSLLCMNGKLLPSALHHSKDMAANDFMGHNGSDGSTMEERITEAGFDWTAVGENVAAGQETVSDVMTAWMNSPEHKANILGDYKMFGTAYAYNADGTYKHYWTQDFGTGDDESCESSSTISSSTSSQSDQTQQQETTTAQDDNEVAGEASTTSETTSPINEETSTPSTTMSSSTTATPTETAAATTATPTTSDCKARRA